MKNVKKLMLILSAFLISWLAVSCASTGNGMNGLIETNKKIEKTVVSGYKAIENGVVSGYKGIENGFVRGYKKIEKKFVETFLEPNSEQKETGK